MENSNNIQRPSWDGYFLSVADTISLRSTCLRRHYGAVIVNDNRIVSTGYNGAPAGLPNCDDVGECPRNKLNLPKGEGYNLCSAVHAEQNALINANRNDLKGATIYIAGTNVEDGSLASGKPCAICEKMIANSGISTVVYYDPEERVIVTHHNYPTGEVVKEHVEEVNDEISKVREDYFTRMKNIIVKQLDLIFKPFLDDGLKKIEELEEKNNLK